MKYSSQCVPLIPDEELPDFEHGYFTHSSKIMACTEEFLVTVEAIRKEGDKNAEAIWNAGFHANIVAHDLLSLIHFMATAKDLWARRVIARMLIVQLSEACDDIPILFGQPYRDACREIGFFEEHEAELNTTCKLLSNFRQTNEQFLKNLRDTVGAHKDQDAYEVVSAIASLNLDKVFDLQNEFYNILRQYGTTSKKALDALSRRKR